MGNRAQVVFRDGDEFSPSVYLHWNGGPESVYAFLDELHRRGCFGHGAPYSAARFVQVVGEFFDQDHFSGLSLGVENGPSSDSPDDLNAVMHGNLDNGLYLVEMTQSGYKMRRFFWSPPHENLGKYFRELTGPEVVKERRAARKHRYNKPGNGDGSSIADTFKKLHPGKITEEDHYEALYAQGGVA